MEHVNKTDELKPCPFCGYKAEIRRTALTSQSRPKFFVACGVCGVETPRIARTKEEAVTAWNRRTAPENKPLTLEQLQQMDGEPAWIQRGKKGTYRVVKDVSYGGEYGGEVRFTDSGPTGLRIEDYGKTWLAYARKPEQEADHA
ncbi:MAG: Lar family restriction alleviation protein [bacterium]